MQEAQAQPVQQATGNQQQAVGIQKATSEQNELLERIIINARLLISGEHKAKILGMLNSGEGVGEGLSMALTFLLQAIVKGLQDKGIEVPPELIVSKNGAAAQIVHLLVQLLGASGRDITPNELKQAMSIGIENFGVKQRMQAAQGQAPTQMQQPEQGQNLQGLIGRG